MQVTKAMKDRTGIRYGKLVALEPRSRYSGNGKSRRQVISWICQCDCGNVTEVDGVNLQSGSIFGCGCNKAWKFTGYGDINSVYWKNCVEWKAKHRKIDFDLTIEDAWEQYLKQDRKCKLSNVDIAFATKFTVKCKGEQTASLDRIDSNKGYSQDNIQWVHKDINWLKNIYSNDEFIYWCRAISDYPTDYTVKYIFDFNYKNSKLYTFYDKKPTTYLTHVRHNAKIRNLEFDLTSDFIYELLLKQERKCTLSNVPIELAINYGKNHKYQTASLDRIDSNLGYTEDNVWWVHKTVNCIKNNYSVEELKLWTKLVANHDQSNGST